MTLSGEFTWRSAIKFKRGIITTIKVDQEIKEWQKYDSSNCKIVEGENALSVLIDKRRSGGVGTGEGPLCSLTRNHQFYEMNLM